MLKPKPIRGQKIGWAHVGLERKKGTRRSPTGRLGAQWRCTKCVPGQFREDPRRAETFLLFPSWQCCKSVGCV